MESKTEKSIVWLRCIATCLIMNSHFSPLYPQKLASLSFGGMFGDCLFFLVSGYCLARQKRSFPDFIWRRLKRVYLPYLLFLPVLFIVGQAQQWTVGYMLFPYKTYGFMTMIMCLYPLYYIFMYLDQHTKIKFHYVAMGVLVLQIIYYLTCFDYNSGASVLDNKAIESSSFFISMLLGGYLRNDSKREGEKNSYVNLLLAVVCFAFYTFQSFIPLPGVTKIMQWFAGIGFVYFLTVFLISLEEKLIIKPVIKTLASVTLEIYFINYLVIDAYKTLPFPVGLAFCLISIVAIAYVLNKIFNCIIDLPSYIRNKNEKRNIA
jgi:peptidoglycan/LPS O-acetylase OafA/YrhL